MFNIYGYYKKDNLLDGNIRITGIIRIHGIYFDAYRSRSAVHSTGST